MALLHETAGTREAWAWMPIVRWIGLAVAALCMAVSTASAQHRDNPARLMDNRTVVRRGIADPVIDGHGWMAVEEAQSASGAGGNVVLLHLPAREVGGGGDASSEDLEGVVRIAGVTRGKIAAGGEGLAWWRNQVYLVVEDAAGAKTPRRRVLSREALRGIGAVYEYFPPKQFMELPPLPTGGELLGMAAREQGPVVWLLEEVKTGEAVANAGLWSLTGGKWARMDSPWSDGDVTRDRAPVWNVRIEGGAARAERAELARLLSWREGVAIATCGKGDAVVAVQIGRVQRGSQGKTEWKRQDFELGELAGLERGMLRLMFVEGAREADDALMAVVMSGESESSGERNARVYQLRVGRKPVEISEMRNIGRGVAAIPMSSAGEAGDASGLVTLIWGDGGGSVAGREAAGFQLREVSAVTGRVMYAGASRSGRHTERPMLQWIVVLVLLAGVGGMVYVMASDPRVMPMLPAGIRPADPIRRLIAAMLDYVPSAIVVALMLGRSALVMLMPSTMLGGAEVALGDLDLRPLGLVIGVTILHVSVCELLLGRSLGKFVMGIRVVSIEAAGAGGESGGVWMMQRPGLGQILVRNLVRWLVPMLALFGMLDVAGRHPGDLAARTLVVADPNDGK